MYLIAPPACGASFFPLEIFRYVHNTGARMLNGRYTVAVEDVQALAIPVLRHRIIPNFHAEAEGITADSLIERLLETIQE